MPEKLETVKESFGRCALKKGFFDDFYSNLQASSPEIPPYFTDVDMDKQKRNLREGISFMLLFAEQNDSGKLAIDKVASVHDSRNINVRPELYRYWVGALIETIKKYDHRFTEEVEKNWEEILQISIKRFVELYKK